MALLTPQVIPDAGINPTYGAVAASDTITVDDHLFLHVKNAGGSADTVTVVCPGTGIYGVAVPDPTFNVPATTGNLMIPIRPGAVDPATGLITVTHSFTTSVTCALLKGS